MILLKNEVFILIVIFDCPSYNHHGPSIHPPLLTIQIGHTQRGIDCDPSACKAWNVQSIKRGACRQLQSEYHILCQILQQTKILLCLFQFADLVMLKSWLTLLCVLPHISQAVPIWYMCDLCEVCFDAFIEGYKRIYHRTQQRAPGRSAAMP